MFHQFSWAGTRWSSCIRLIAPCWHVSMLAPPVNALHEFIVSPNLLFSGTKTSGCANVRTPAVAGGKHLSSQNYSLNPSEKHQASSAARKTSRAWSNDSNRCLNGSQVSPTAGPILPRQRETSSKKWRRRNSKHEKTPWPEDERLYQDLEWKRSRWCCHQPAKPEDFSLGREL